MTRGELIAARRVVIDATRYCRPLGDSLPPLLPDEPPPLLPEEPPLLGARPVCPEPLVDEPAPALPWPLEPWPVEPWPVEPWPPRPPAPTLSRVVLEPPTVVDLPLRTVLRVETLPPPTATPARRLWITTFDGS